MSLMFKRTKFPSVVPYTVVLDAEYIWDSRLNVFLGSKVARLTSVLSGPNALLLYLTTSNQKLLVAGKLLQESGLKLSIVDTAYWSDDELRNLVETATLVYVPLNSKVLKLTPEYLRAKNKSHDEFLDSLSLLISGHVQLDNKTRHTHF
jgi:hypothetical protein